MSVLQGGRVLRVEDNETNHTALLFSEGMRVTVAANGALALQLLADEAFDVVLMDLQMPVMDGLEAARRVRQVPQLSELPIIAMTADVVAGVKERVLEAGMNDYVAKPISPAGLFAALMRWLPDGVVEAGLPQDAVERERPAEPDRPPASGVLDQEAGLGRVAGRREAYARMLRAFARHNADMAAQLRSAHEQGDLAQVAFLAHALKGAAGNLGAVQVQAAATGVERAARQEPPDQRLPAHLEALEQALVRALEACAEAAARLEPPAAPASAPVPPEELEERLGRLRGMLEASDAGARHALTRLRGLVPDELVIKMEGRLRSYDFDGALGMLNAEKQERDDD